MLSDGMILICEKMKDKKEDITWYMNFPGQSC